MFDLQHFFCDFGYSIIPRGSNSAGEITTTFPEEWLNAYVAGNFHLQDPIFRLARTMHGRTRSKILTPDDMASPLYEEAAPHNAASNVFISTKLGGSQMILGGVNDTMKPHHLAEATEAAKRAHRQVLLNKLDQLTDKQLDILDLADEGCRDSELAYELGISPSAVNQRKAAICRTLGIDSFQFASRLYATRKWGNILV